MILIWGCAVTIPGEAATVGVVGGWSRMVPWAVVEATIVGSIAGAEGAAGRITKMGFPPGCCMRKGWLWPPVNNNGAVLAPVMTPPVFRTKCWEEGVAAVAMVTMGRCWALAETEIAVVRGVEAEELGFGNNWGWVLLLLWLETTLVVAWPLSWGCKVYWMVPPWITVGVVDDVKIGWGPGLSMKLLGMVLLVEVTWLLFVVFWTTVVDEEATVETTAAGEVPKISSFDSRTSEAEVPSRMEAAAFAAWSWRIGESSYKCFCNFSNCETRLISGSASRREVTPRLGIS